QILAIATSHPQKTQTPRQAKRVWDTKIAQSSDPPEKVSDEAVHKELGDRVERAATTAVSLDAEQDNGNILKTQSTTIPNVPLSQGIGGNTPGSDEERLEQDDLTYFVPPTPHDSPLSGGHTPGSDEGRPNINELMAICTYLSNMVLALETSKAAQDLVALERMQRDRAAQEEASNAALTAKFDDVQARMDADALLAARLQEEER
ncbi:hypothetical protein Tco_0119370, partial [Tanacetum coccineum]